MLQALETFVRRLPLIGPLALRLAAAYQRRYFQSSADYWEVRYRGGGSSGSGSYGRLAEFKAEVINGFVARRGIQSVIELGCGDGNQLSLARYPSYVGIDISRAAVERCRDRFRDDPTKRFHAPDDSDLAENLRAELALSLDVIYHLVEDGVFDRYMRTLFDSAERFVIAYSTNDEIPSPFAHVRHRRFTDWVEANRPAWRVVETIPNRYPSEGKNGGSSSPAEFYVFARDAAP
jgi:hypothetical protein